MVFWTDAGDGGWRSVPRLSRFDALSAVAADIDCFPGPDRGQRLPQPDWYGVTIRDNPGGIQKIRALGASKVHAVRHSMVLDRRR